MQDPTPIEPIQIVVDAEDDGQRLDRVLATQLPALSRSLIQRWIEEGRILQNGVAATRKTKALAAGVIDISPAPPPTTELLPEDIPFDVLFEDAHPLVLDKPAGLVVHPGPGHPDGTLVNAILHHTKVEGLDPTRPGIVHRLDKDTSGVMVVAKSQTAHERLVRLFQAHDLDRRYLAIVVGHPPGRAVYDTFHGRHHADRKRFTSKTDRGKRAVTHMRMLEALHGAAVVECTLHTGRTHQIRVHLADHGHPVLGDPLYGRSVSDRRVRAEGQRLGRQALHAQVLGFEHPITGQRLDFAAPPPDDFIRAKEALRLLPNR